MKKIIFLLLLFSLFTVSYSNKEKITKSFILIGMEKEVDDVANNSPYKSRLVESSHTISVPKDYLASGITYDWDRDEYLLVSDHPHILMPKKISTLITLDSTLENQSYTTKIPSDSDLEGITYIGQGIAYSISERGLIYILKRNRKGEWKFIKNNQWNKWYFDKSCFPSF